MYNSFPRLMEAQFWEKRNADSKIWVLLFLSQTQTFYAKLAMIVQTHRHKLSQIMIWRQHRNILSQQAVNCSTASQKSLNTKRGASEKRSECVENICMIFLYFVTRVGHKMYSSAPSYDVLNWRQEHVMSTTNHQKLTFHVKFQTFIELENWYA